ncbi:MAG: sulfatase-like hydrolase/transferase [Pseudomonadota bacterium]
MPDRNVLLVTLDQLAARAINGDLAALAPTPNFDRLKAEGVNFLNHRTVTVPCGPARASLLTGLYAMNHRAIRNGTPLARHHATVATEARKAGYEPLLFGYSDVTPDPTTVDPEDPDLSVYEGVAPGFRELCEMRMEAGLEWPAYLRAQGYDFTHSYKGGLPTHQRPVTPEGQAPRPSDPAPYAAAHSDTAYLTDRTLEALDIRRGTGWFAHLTYFRPHPTLIAPAPWNTVVAPADVPAPDTRVPDHPFIHAYFSGPSAGGLWWCYAGDPRDIPASEVAELRAVYLGLLAEVDHHLGRVMDWLEASGEAARTLLIVTADHGEMLGEKGMWGKQTVFSEAYHVPLIVRGPGVEAAGHSTDLPTESVDLTPTILDWIGRRPSPAMDGVSLGPVFSGDTPGGWRKDHLCEVDFGEPHKETRFMRALGLSADQSGAMLLRDANWSYVHFGGAVPPMLFDLSDDPGETRNVAGQAAYGDAERKMAQRLLTRIAERRDRRMTSYSFGT